MSLNVFSTLRPIYAFATAIASLIFASTASAQSNHTVTFSGSTANFNAAEKISAAVNNTDYYVTFDASNLYVGAFRTVGSFGATDNLAIYIDTDPNSTPTSGTGTTAGQSYNGVTGTLPFTANYNVHAEQGFQEARSEASSWLNTISGVTYHTGSTWREVAIPFSSIGNPDALYLTMWMGFSGGIFSNAPGADLGSGANPTVTGYIGGFGVSSADCIPVNSINVPITASIVDAVPAAGITYGKVSVTSASITATNNFNIAAGGSIQVSGGTLDVSGRTIQMGGSSVGTGKGTTINYTAGTLTTNNSTTITFLGEGLLSGSALTYNGAFVLNRKFTPLSAGSTTIGNGGSIDIRANAFVNTNALTYASGSTLMYNTGSTFTASTEWTANAPAGTGVPSNVVIGNNVANTILSFGSSAQYRQVNGDLTVTNATSGNGLTLSSAVGGNLQFAGNFAQNGTLTTNTRPIYFVGTANKTLSAASGSLTLDFLVLNAGANFLQLGSSTNLTFNGNANALQFLGTSGGLDLNQRTVTMNANATVFLTGAGAKNIISTGGQGTLAFAGTSNLTSPSGTLITNSNVRMTLAGTFTINVASALTINGILQLNSGGAIATNAPLYTASSTLIYNTTGTYGRSLEWSATGVGTIGSTVGYPNNVQISNSTTLNLGNGGASTSRACAGNLTIDDGCTLSMNITAMTAALTVVGNLSIGNGTSGTLTLSASAGGDLNVRGNFTKNSGTFTCNNRQVNFSGTNPQTYSSNTSENINFLLVSNTGGTVTFNSSIVIPNSGNTTTFNASTTSVFGSSATLTLSEGTTYTGNGAGTTVTFNGTMRNTGTNGATINSSATTLLFGASGVYNHNMTRSAIVASATSLGTIPTASWNATSTCLISGLTNPGSGGWLAGSTQTFGNFSWNTPAMTTNPNMGGATLTASGTFSIVSTNTGEFRMGGNTSGTITCGAYTQSGGTLDMSTGTGSGTINCSGNFNFSAGVIKETGTGAAHLINFNGSSAQSITLASAINTDINYTFNNPNGFTLNSAIAVNNNRTVTHTNGVFSGAGSFSYGSTGTNLIYNGSASLTTSNYELPSSSGPVNIQINNAGGINLHAARTITGVLTLTDGIFNIGAFDFTVNNNANGAITNGGSFSSTNMVAAAGTGRLRRLVTTGTTYTYPIGETTGTTEYSPVTLNFTAVTAGSIIGVNVTDGNHPQLDNTPVQTDYISRYWTFSNTGATAYTYTATFTYVAADIVGSELNINANMWNGTAWTQDALSSASSNVLTTATGLTNTTMPLGATAQFTGRVNNGTTYTWNQSGTASFATAANWTPNRTTLRTDDILVFSNGATTTATGVTAQTIGKLLVSGNTNVSLQSASSLTLTIGGNNGTDLSVASGSTLQIASTGGNALTLAFANSTTTTVDGTLTLATNTGFNNAINFTNTGATINGSLNSIGLITSTISNLNFASGSFYNHNFTTTTGTIPTATWNVNSTCRIQGYTTGGVAGYAPAGLAQAFGNFTWNCTAQTTNDPQLNGALTSIAGNFSVTATNSRQLILANASTQTITVGGNMTVSGANTNLVLSSGNGGKTTIDVAGNYSQSTASSSVDLCQGNATSLGVIKIAGTYNLASGTITQTAATTTGGIALLEFDGTTAQSVTNSGTISNAIDIRFNNNAGFTLSGTLSINNAATLYRTAGAISGGTVSYNATNTTLCYDGSTNLSTSVEFPSSNGPVNVKMNCTGVISLTAARSLPSSGIWTNLSGIFSLGAFDLTLNNTAVGAIVNSSPDASNMIAASGTGQLKRTINSAINLYYYIGDVTGTPEYSGFGLNFNFVSGTYVMGVRVVDDTSANLSLPYSPIDYLSRHWIVTVNTGTGLYSYIPSMTYDVPGDVEGTENNLQVAVFPQGASSWNHYSTSLVSPTITKTGSNLSDLNFALNNATFSGRTPVKYWDGSTSTSWNVAANWTPSGVPTSSDNIDINGNAVNPCILSSSATVNHLTLSDGGDLTLTSAASLTVAGNFTYNPLAAISFDCASTFTLSNTTFNQTVPALTYGNLNLGTGSRTLANTGTINICGNYTPTTGALTTTGSTVNFMGTAAQSILSNNTSFNNLTISNTSNSVTATNNVTINGAMQINASGRYINSGATLTISSVATANVDGFLRNSGTVTTTGTLTVAATGTYEHNYTNSAGTIPTATWSVGSTCLVRGYTSNTNAPSGLGQSFHHFTWNCGSQTGDISLLGNLTTVNGNLTVAGTNTGSLIFESSGAVTMNIGGDFIQTGGDLVMSSGNNTDCFINLTGNYSQTGGALDMYSGGASGSAEIRLQGNYSRTGNGTITATGSGTADGLFRFDGVNQTITETSSGSNKWIDYYINNGSTTTLLSNLVIQGSSATYTATVTASSGGTLDCGTFVISGTPNTRVNVPTGGTIRTAHAQGFAASGASGSVQTVTRTYSSAAGYAFNGTTNQNTGNFWTATTPTANAVARLYIDNTGTSGNNTVTMNSGTNVTVSALLSFPATDVGPINMLTNRLSISSTSTTAVSRLGAGYVIGELQRGIATGVNTYVFDVGTANGYAPASMAFNSVTNAGNIIVKATAGPHPQAATDGLSQTKYANVYWTVSNNGTTLTSTASTFSYQSTDLVGGALASSLKLARYSAGWTYPTSSTGANQITGSSLTNTTTFGEFFAADCGTFAVSITPSAPSICNGSSTGLTASANFGSPTFAWSPSTALSATNIASVTANPSSSITYTVTGTTAQNCTASNTVTVTVNSRPTGVISGTQNLCNGSSATLSIAVTGTGPWSGTLSSGAAFSGSSSPISVSVSPTINTTYTIATLVDANCTAASGDKTGSAIVTIKARPTGAITGTQNLCNGSSANLSIAVTGTGPWSGTLSDGTSFSGSASPISVSVSPTSNTTYTIATLVDANCTAASGDKTGSAIVSINSRPTGAISGSTTICNGGSATLSIAVTGTGPWSGTLSSGASFSGSTSPISVSVSPSGNTSYTIATLSDANCTANAGDKTGTAAVSVNARPTGAISGSTTICNGGSATLSIAVTGTGPWSGTLSSGASFSGSTSPITVSVSPSGNTSYTISTLVDANCTANAGDKTGTAVVTVNARPTGAISGSATICNGGSATLSIAVTGTGPWSGTLSSGASFSGSTSPISVSVSPSSNTSYTIATLVDANCTANAGDKTGTAAITVNARPTGVISGTQTVCDGSSASLSIAVTGTGPWSGTLSDGTSFSGSSSPISVAVTPSVNTTYTIATLSDANCTANAGDKTGSAAVTLNVRPTGFLGGNQTVCAGGTGTVYINTTGSGNYSGTLNPGAIAFSGSGSFLMIDVTPSVTTPYTIATLIDDNCAANAGDLTGSPTVTVHALPTASISGTANVCEGQSSTITFTGTPDSEVTYNVNGGSNQVILLDGSGNATLNTGLVTANQVYNLVSVDDYYCPTAVSGSATITRVDAPDATISGATSICTGSSTTISFSGTPSDVVTYSINGGAGITITLNGSGVASFNTGALASNTTYTLVSVANGTCSISIGTSVVVTVTSTTFYQDSDGDGFGNPSSTISACTAPVGYVTDNTDCCDTNADVNPLTEWWLDQDNDGYGGYIFNIGCLSGVNCSTSSWPAQLIPYYPGAHGGAAYASDCNDNAVTAHPGATEICNNGIDENCNGVADEGCAGPLNDTWNNAFLINTNNPNVLYPNCLPLNGTLVNASISPQGNSGNVGAGGGRDVWYKFVAPSNAVQVKLNTSGFDGVIELQNSSASQLDSENINASIGGSEVLNYTALTPGQTYYVAIRNYHNTNTGNFSLCVSPLMPSGCALSIPVAGFSLCNSYKAVYRGAASYSFNFTGTGGSAAFPYVTTTASSINGLLPLSTPALDLRNGGVYSVRVDANYIVYNGLGVAEPMITVIGSTSSVNCTGVTIEAQPNIEVILSQRCPASLTRNNYLIGSPTAGSTNICGASNFTYEFTKVTDCTGVTTAGAPFTVSTAGSTPYLILAAAFPSSLPNTGYWKVRIRPNYPGYNGTYGPYQVIQVTGSSTSMMLSEEHVAASERSLISQPSSAIFPNPNRGELVNINLTDISKGDVYVKVADALGKVVFTNRYSSEGSLNTSIVFDGKLKAGIYLVEFVVNGEKITERMIVE